MSANNTGTVDLYGRTIESKAEPAVAAPQDQNTTAIPDDVKAAAKNAVGPRVTVYASVGSKHIGGKTYPTGPYNANRAGRYYDSVDAVASDGTYDVTIYGNNGKFNTPLNEHNPGASVNVMWPVAQAGSGDIEAGVSLGGYTNSFGKPTKFVLAAVAYRQPELAVNALGTVSGSIGTEIGAATGYHNPGADSQKPKIVGQIYGEMCQQITGSLLACVKVGAIPTRYTTNHPELMNGRKFTVQDGRSAELLRPPTTSSRGIVATGQIGLSWRF